MKYVYILLILLTCAFGFGQNRSLAIGFVENKGQIVDQKGKPNDAVKYLLNTNGLNVQLRSNGFSYDIYESKKISKPAKKIMGQMVTAVPDGYENEEAFELKTKYHRIDIDFIGSNQNVILKAEEKSVDYDNYYNVVSKPVGVLYVHKFQKVTYVDIYPNIDVVFFIPEDKSKPVEYNFIVKEKGNISAIQMKINGSKTELIDNTIKMKVRFGTIEETLPLSWTEVDKKEVAIHYKKIKTNVYGFDTDENISGKKLIIDPTPVRLWGSYYGTGYNFELVGIENDAYGNVYFSGISLSTTNIATSGSHSSFLSGYSDGFLVKFDANGARIWGTYYGGNNSDNFVGIKEKNNELILTGSTNSTTNIATPGAFKENLSIGTSTYKTNDCFLVKFNLDGVRIWGSYFGGESRDSSINFEVDSSGNIVIVGETYSINGIATTGTFKDFKNQPININTVGEGFIAKFNSNGNQIWGSYYNLCQIHGIDIDSNSNIFFSGNAYSSIPNMTTSGTHQPIFMYNTDTNVANENTFIVKFNPHGQRIWGTYYGNGWEYNHCLKVDNSDDILISGYTRSTQLISTPNAHQTDLNINVQTPADAYLAKFNQNGQLLWGTYYGGDDREDLRSYTVDVDESNNIFLAGNTFSDNNISTIDAYNVSPNGWYDSFIIKFTSSGLRLWGTYFGGNNGDYTSKIKYDKLGVFYIVGNTYSSNGISTQGSHEEIASSSQCYFIQKFKDCQSAALAQSNNPCIGGNLNLTASGGTNYSWSGPNGFTSSLQNPILNGVSAVQSGLYSCAITGTGGCDNTITVNVIVGDVTKPVPDIASLPTINGDCTTSISIPTATDNCAGSINGTTTDPLVYTLSGTYVVHWSYDDGNGNVQTQNQSVNISAVSLPTVLSPQKFCIQQNATLNDIAITGLNIKWYNALTGGNLLVDTTLLQDGITYYASQTINSCESSRVGVTIQIQNTLDPNGFNQQFCAIQNATLADVLVTGTTINWYATNASTSILPTTTILNDATTYYASQTVNGCESIVRLPITISLIYTLNANDYSTSICDVANDTTETIILSDYNALLINSIVGNIFTYYKTNFGAENLTVADLLTNNQTLNIGLNTYYVRIDSINGCHQVVKLNLTLISEPIISIKDEVVLCENESINVNAGPGFSSYLWSTGASTTSTTITATGNYSVTVTKNHGNVTCSSTKNFSVVLSNAPEIASINIYDWTDNQNSITIIATGIGVYEYSLDNIFFQESALFEGLPNGAYTVYVKDTQGCGFAQKDVYLLNYPKFFTPNGDGYNDTWQIKYSRFEPNFEVRIFDRYSKLLKVMYNLDAWDGTYSGQLLPSDDYWFYVIRNDQRIHKGHFTLKR